MHAVLEGDVLASLRGGNQNKAGPYPLADSGCLVPPFKVSVMRDPVSFAAQCPTCKNEVSQGPRDPDEIRRLLKEDCVSFYCELCDLEWEPSLRELANVEQLLCEPVVPTGGSNRGNEACP